MRVESGFSHSTPVVGVAAWCATRKEVLPRDSARLSRNEAIVLPCVRPPIPHPLGLPSPRLRLNHHPIYLQLRSAKSFQSSETNGPHARPSIPGAQCISDIPSHPATLDSIMLKSFTREYQVLQPVRYRSLLISSFHPSSLCKRPVDYLINLSLPRPSVCLGIRNDLPNAYSENAKLRALLWILGAKRRGDGTLDSPLDDFRRCNRDPAADVGMAQPAPLASVDIVIKQGRTEGLRWRYKGRMRQHCRKLCILHN
ncbi:hypothetical protein BKA56DRAFT_55658 [Ilyonectria sp. MPI-CAGE-AT-0026]|nr:hypothetical protein BKA56DRAFT_55658 [Ilyonectria sp. MPI-CAGE-AT-0026]